MSKEKIPGVNRKAAKLELELSIIARNRAAELGGNDTSPKGIVKENKQTFLYTTALRWQIKVIR